MMDKQIVARAHARTRSFERRVAHALDVVRMAANASASWYIALSGGKDSTCVLDLARSILPDAPAVISIHKWMLPETTEYLSRVSNLHYVASGSTHGTDGWGRNWRDNREAEAHFPGIPWFDHDADEQNFGRPEGGCFLGLRAEEASYRKIFFAVNGPLHRSKKHGGVWLCSPIYRWATLDVWAYIYSRGLDYNRAYDVMDRIGVPWPKQRIGPMCIGVSTMGSLIKRGWPELWARYAAEHPQATTYA